VSRNCRGIRKYIFQRESVHY